MGLRDGQKEAQPRMRPFRRDSNTTRLTTLPARQIYRAAGGRASGRALHRGSSQLTRLPKNAEERQGTRKHTEVRRSTLPPLSPPRCEQNKACMAGQGPACAQMYNTHMKTSGKLNSTSGGPRSAAQAAAGGQARSCACTPPPSTWHFQRAFERGERQRGFVLVPIH